MTKNNTFYIILIIISILVQYSLNAKPKQKGLIPATAGSFQNNSSEQILIYYDVDRDGKVDILTKSISRTSGNSFLNVYLWNTMLKHYHSSGSFPVSSYASLKTLLISSFNLSPQLLLISYNQDVTGSAYITVQNITCANYQCKLSTPFTIPEINTAIDPITPTLITMQSDIELLYHIRGVPHLLQFKSDYTYITNPLQQQITGTLQPLPVKYSYNGDYDGDCNTDIILLSQSDKSSVLQFLKGNIYNYYTVTSSFVLPESVQHFSVQDINFDGKNDLVILLTSGDIQIHYNRNTEKSTLCQGSDNPYDFYLMTESAAYIQRVSLGKQVDPNSVLLFGDYNNDGYDDLTLTLLDSANLPTAALFKNIPCTGTQCGTYNPQFIQQSLTLNLRTFTIQTISGLSAVIPRLSFIDILDDGNLDLMAELQIEDSSGRYLAIQPIYNTYDYDAFFLAVTLLARRQYDDPLSNSEYIGGCASVYVTLLSGQFAPRTGNQLSQAGQTLQLPRIRMGLGRTNNYLQSLIITLPRKIENTLNIQFQWSPIIPNSNILVIPPPDQMIVGVKNQWLLKMIIEPTQKMGAVAFLVIVSLAVVGIVILHLTKKEKQQDRQNQQSFYTLLR